MSQSSDALPYAVVAAATLALCAPTSLPQRGLFAAPTMQPLDFLSDLWACAGLYRRHLHGGKQYIVLTWPRTAPVECHRSVLAHCALGLHTCTLQVYAANVRASLGLLDVRGGRQPEGPGFCRGAASAGGEGLRCIGHGVLSCIRLGTDNACI